MSWSAGHSREWKQPPLRPRHGTRFPPEELLCTSYLRSQYPRPQWPGRRVIRHLARQLSAAYQSGHSDLANRHHRRGEVYRHGRRRATKAGPDVPDSEGVHVTGGGEQAPGLPLPQAHHRGTDEIVFTFSALEPTPSDPSRSQTNSFHLAG